MAEWNEDIEIELRRAWQAQNPGRVRTSARRIAGIAIREFQKLNAIQPTEQDHVSLLRLFMRMENVPADIRSAAARLEARLAPDFTSLSIDPIGDAMIIVEFVRKKPRANREQ